LRSFVNPGKDIVLLLRRVTIVLAIVGVAASCAPHRTRGGGVTGPSPAAVITSRDLARYVTRGSLMDALHQLRPFWLTPRGTPTLVSVDGAAPTEISYLQLIPVSTVHEVRLQRASSSTGHAAIMPNGDVILGDVILVVTRQAGRGAGT